MKWKLERNIGVLYKKIEHYVYYDIPVPQEIKNYIIRVLCFLYSKTEMEKMKASDKWKNTTRVGFRFSSENITMEDFEDKYFLTQRVLICVNDQTQHLSILGRSIEVFCDLVEHKNYNNIIRKYYIIRFRGESDYRLLRTDNSGHYQIL